MTSFEAHYTKFPNTYHSKFYHIISPFDFQTMLKKKETPGFERGVEHC